MEEVEKEEKVTAIQRFEEYTKQSINRLITIQKLQRNK